MSLFHFPFKRYSTEYSNHYKTYSPIIKERNLKQDYLLKELGKTLTIAEYKAAKKTTWSASQTKLRAYTKKKNQLAKAHSFFGRGSFKFWLKEFGVVLLGLYFSIRSVILDTSKKTGHLYLSMAGLTVCFFWLYHLFFKTAADFYNSTYITTQLTLSILVAFFTTVFVKHQQNRKATIKELVQFIFRTKDHHYPNVASKALYAQTHNKAITSKDTVADNTLEFEEDLITTLEKVAPKNKKIEKTIKKI